MTGFIMKLISCPLIVVLASQVLPQLNYPTIYQAISVGIVLAIMGHVMELLILRHGTFWISNVADFIASTMVLYYSQRFIQDSYITISGAIITGVMLGISEYALHSYLISSKKVSPR